MRAFARYTFLLLAASLFLLAAYSQTDPTKAAALPSTDYDRALQAQDWPAALQAAQKLVDQEPSAENLRRLAWTQHRAKQPQAALATYQRAIDTAAAQKPAPPAPMAAWNDLASSLYLGQGNALLSLRRTDEAIAAYGHAAELASNPSIPRFNICATYYNQGNIKAALDACRTATVADPLRADAWFLLGSVLFADLPLNGSAPPDAQHETRHALQKYLELAPDGSHAADVKAMLEMVVK